MMATFQKNQLQEAFTLLQNGTIAGCNPPTPLQAETTHLPSCIQVLPPELVNRIAAGEVVERPASVVKELVENAIDAGATAIEISINNYGKSIRIADNGKGMNPKEAQLAFLNHATSKIKVAEDLEAILTLGFRGEALSSIGAISKFSCYTRTKNQPDGTLLVIEGGKLCHFHATGCSVGTVMEVDDLFFNTPARLKFLKSPKTELAQVEEMVQGLALSHPNVQLSLTLNEKLTFKTDGEDQLKQTVTQVFGWKPESTNTLLETAFEDPLSQLKLRAVFASPAQESFHKRSKKAWWMLLNGRTVRCAILATAIKKAFESLVPHGVYPFCAIWLEMPATQVDVNVHPTKKEVRYANSEQIFKFVVGGIRRALQDQFHATYGLHNTMHPLANQSHSAQNEQQHGTHLQPYPAFSSATPSNPFTATPPTPQNGVFWRSPSPTVHTTQQGQSTHHTSMPTQTALAFYEPLSGTEEQPSQSPIAVSLQQRQWRVIGQLFNTYVLLETPKGLMVVDQHIASERWCYEALIKQSTAEKQVVQPLLNPILLDVLSAEQVSILAQYQGWLKDRMGFACERNQADTLWVLCSVPQLYPNRKTISPVQQLEAVLEQLALTGEAELDTELLFATLACHTAVRAGDVLSQFQMERLVVDWLACSLPWSCPHGRPIAHTIEAEELNNFFDRPSLPVSSVYKR
jgi:DNA mismatch repair protein MutL